MATPKTPDHFELWGDLSRQNRFLRLMAAALLTAIVLLLGAFTLLATRPLVAVRVNQLGAADLVENIAPSNAPGPEEAEHVSRLVSQYLLEVTSGSVQRDLTKALALMTQPFARAYRDQVQADPMLGKIEQGNIRTQVTFDPALTKVRPETQDGRVVRYFVQLAGKVEVYRQDVYTAPLLQSPVVVRTTLLVVPRGPVTLNGLLVDFFEKTYPEVKPSTAPAVAPLPSSATSAKETR